MQTSSFYLSSNLSPWLRTLGSLLCHWQMGSDASLVSISFVKEEYLSQMREQLCSATHIYPFSLKAVSCSILTAAVIPQERSGQWAAAPAVWAYLISGLTVLLEWEERCLCRSLYGIPPSRLAQCPLKACSHLFEWSAVMGGLCSPAAIRGHGTRRAGAKLELREEDLTPLCWCLWAFVRLRRVVAGRALWL